MSGLFRTALNILFTRKYPVSLVHFVTNQCNARCAHCFLDFEGQAAANDQLTIPTLLEADPRNRKQELTLEEIDKATRHMGPCLKNVNLTGGEPFLRKDLLEIARLYFKHARVQTIFITTHGGYPDRVLPFAETLAKEFPDRQLIFSISIDHFRDEHDQSRKVKGLFENAMQTYHAVQDVGPNVMSNIGVTISHTNFKIVDELYEQLIQEYRVKAITVGAARDEGVYQLPSVSKQDIHEAFFRVHEKLDRDMASGRLTGYDFNTLAGRLLNAKNKILFRVIRRTLLEDRYISPCHAGAIFGVLGENGDVFPCEILDRPLGNIRDYQYDLTSLWRDRAAKEARTWIRKTNCYCDYDCAWTFNILGNWRYQPALLKSVLKPHSSK